MKSVNPYLNFDGNCEEAFKFYQSVFGGELDIVRFKDMGDNMGASGDDLDKIANAGLPIGGGTMLLGSDVMGSWGQSYDPGNNFYINLEAESLDETKRLFHDLSDGGEVEMPLEEPEWAELFGMVIDKYGTRWMVYYPGNKA
ncbi:VOC family protein [Fodinibius salsisoli]|uniref:VOC family protein n=1 Tax=Fodinibius salsisoli TaxID=2820877 RepID=A0ABT3PHX0_9BACT|nr:VOC family protein [Fodinibius salsisoli]MCW9705521.1 VOC family protein [Fodinibius salsisoli]